jgi:hypothetical protein
MVNPSHKAQVDQPNQGNHPNLKVNQLFRRALRLQ